MFGGNPAQMEQMLKQMGIDFKEIKASEITVETEDGDTLVFEDVSINQLQGQGQEVYQIMGSPTEEVSPSDSEEEVDDATEDTDDDEYDVDDGYTEEDVELVALRANVSDDAARSELENTGGDLAQAISNLEE